MTAARTLLFSLAAALAIVAAVAACAGTAYAQQVDDSLPPLADLTITSEYDFDDYHRFGFVSWAVTVKNNTVGAHPGMQFHLVKVRYTISDRVRGDTTGLLTISNLPPGGSEKRTVRSLVTIPGTNDGPAKVPQRLYAEIIGIESDPVESPRFRFNNATEHWALVNRRVVRSGDGANYFTNGDVGVDIPTISDRLPPAAGATTFTVTAYSSTHRLRNFPGVRSAAQDHTLFDVQVEISLSPGLSFAGTQPDAPSGTKFNTTTGIWNVGTPGNRTLTLPVAVNLTADSLADLPLEERCLTVEVVRAVPWFASDPLRRADNTATACLGQQIFNQGETTLFHYVDCVGVTSTPCTSTDTLELVVERETGNYIQPEGVIVHIQDPQGRHDGKWRTGKTTYHNQIVIGPSGVQATFSFLPRSYNSYTFTISDVSPKQRPGAFSIIGGGAATGAILDADTKKSLGPLTLPATTTTNPYPVFLSVSALGTYKLNLTVGATKSGTPTPYTDTGTYTFHVGPIAELEAQDGGANPAVAAGQRAYTIVAVNNGPDDAPAQVTLTGLNAGDYVSHTATNDTTDTAVSSFDPDTGVWTIDELKNKDYYQTAKGRDGEALTIITSASLDTEITAAISNNQDYQVCIDSSGDDVDAANEAACTGTTGNTWHTTEYYDYISGNDSATIRAREGTGAYLPVIESVEALGPAVIKITWSTIAGFSGRPVTHYAVERDTNPRETVADDVAGTSYVDTDMEAGENPRYRVRAVNDWEQEGPWSLPSGGRPGAPGDFSATAGSGQITLSWSAPDGVTVTGYNLDYSTDGGDTWNWLPTGQTRTALAATPTSYDHTGLTLTPGATWSYRLQAVGDGFKSDWEETSVTVPYPKPGVPKDFTASGQSETQAELSWTAPATVTHVNVTGYELDFSQDGGVTWTRLTGTPTLDGTTWTLTHSDSGLAADAARQYRARAAGTVGSGSEQVEVKSDWAYALATENYPSPGAPRDFAATAASDTEVNLSWNAPEAVTDVNLTGYELEVSIDRGVTWTSVATASTLGPGATTHPHTDAANPLSSKPRQYRLKAVGTVGGSTYESGWVFAVPAGEVGPPQDLAAAADGRNRIDLSWGEPGIGADLVTGYRIDHTPAAAEDWRTLEHGYRTAPRSYEHGGLLPGERHCYRVAATYAGGTGPFAARACATTEGEPEHRPGEPENPRIARVGSNYVTLEWDPPSAGGAVEYYEWRSNIHNPVKVSPRTATSVTVRGLPRSQTYGFQVRAGNSHGPGGWSRSVPVTLHRAGSAVKPSPAELEVEKGGSGSFNLSLHRSPRWPLRVSFIWEGPDCLTESLPYQQGKILLPTNPPPSKEFWEDFNWGPPEDRWARPWREGLDIRLDASGCQGGETAVVNYDLSTVPFSNLAGLSLWDALGLNKEEWEEKWGVDPLDGASGPSVKVTVSDSGPTGNVGGQQSSPGAEGQPTAVTLALSQARVSESGGQVTVTATLDAPAPEGGMGGFLFAGEDGTASEDIDFTMPLSIFIPGGQRSGTATLSITGDDVDEGDETVALSAMFDIGTALLEDKITLTITDDDTAGVTVSAASGLEVEEDGTASYTVVLDSRPTAAVTVSASSGDAGAASVSPESRTFQPPGWNIPLTFTVRGVADTDTNDESVGISHGVTSGDARYAVLPVDTVRVSVSDTTPPGQQQQAPPNQAPTVSSAIADAAIVNENGTHRASLSGVFSDADRDALTITAGSSNTAVATVSVSAGYSSLTVTAKARGAATITVTADDGKGGTVEDVFTVKVKAAPVVASAISDLSLEVGGTQDLALSGVFSDADGDALSFTATSTDLDVANALEFHGTLTIIGALAGSATVTVTAQDSDGNTVSDEFDVTVTAPQQQAPPNQAPTVSGAIADATIVNESGTKDVALSGVFSDADSDALTITAASSNTAAATVSVSGGYSSLTVTAKARGTATITVTANDGNGGTVEDAFTVKVKAAPTVSAAIADVSGLEVGATQDVSLSGVFSDADGDALTITAVSSDETRATVSVAADGSKLTLTGVAEGATAITVTAQDSDGNRVSDAFDAPVAKKYTALIARMYQWREDPKWREFKEHTDRWDRALLAFGEAVSDTSLTPMTADEAQELADRGSAWSRWVEVAAALREIEAGGQQEQPNQAPTVSGAIADVTIVNESGTKEVSLTGVFDDADGDSLTVSAASSDEAVAAVSVSSGGSSLTVTAKARGRATITVTADDGNGGTVSDAFAVTVKAAPVVASAIADMSGLEEGSTRDVSLSGVFSDADGDALTITAVSSDETRATVSVLADGSKLTLSGVADGTAAITVTAQDADGNTVSDAFDVSVVGPPSPVTNLSCVASTGQVLFQWDAPEWSGAELYAYDYDLTLPDGKSQQVRLRGYPLVRESGDYQVGREASISVKAVYELADESVVYSEAAALTCTVAG